MPGGGPDGRKGRETYANQLVFGPGREIFAVRAEADASNIKIAGYINRVILKNTQFLASLHIVDLRRPVAASCDKFAIVAEANTADHAFMGERVNKIDIEHARHVFVEDGEPVISLLL